MANYILAYHGAKQPASPEEGAKGRKDFMDWIAGLGDAVVNPGTPLTSSRMVSADGVSDIDISDVVVGFSVVKAESISAAIEIAKGSPFLKMGTIEVAEQMQRRPPAS